MFPVLIVSGLNLIFVAPLIPSGEAIRNRIMRIAVGDSSWQVVALTFIVLRATGLLYNLNIPIIRLYEGYPWDQSWIGRLMVRRKRATFDMAAALYPTLRSIARLLGRHNAADPMLDRLADRQR